MGEGNLLDGNGPAEQSAFPSRITPQAAGRCGRCWGAGKNMIPSTSNALPNLQVVFVEVTCSVCGGTGNRQPAPDPAETERAAVVFWLRAQAAEFRRMQALCRFEKSQYSCGEQAHALKEAADQIERGEHRQEEPRDGR